MRQFVVIGAGRFGRSVATTLAENGCQVLLLDSDENRVQQMAETVTQAIQLDVTDEKALQSLDLGEMDVWVVAIGSKLEASILATMKLKEMGVKTVVSKAGSMPHKKILARVGADIIVFPERDMGVRTANRLLSPDITDYINISSGYSLVEIRVPEHLVGQTLAEANIRAQYGVDVVAIKRQKPQIEKDGQTGLSEEMEIAPSASEVFAEGDVLVVIGKVKDIETFRMV
ncbi:MAG TPA: TrkA family potassium uptake protein [bacterium]|nr:TrkA family potassium uptake protein [bacterium]